MKTNKPWIFYDADCGICRNSVAVALFLAGRDRLAAAPLGTRWARRLFGLPPAAPLEEMKALDADRKRLGGIDGVLMVAGMNPLTAPLVWLARIPPVKRLFGRAYRWFARNRACVNGVCELGRKGLSVRRIALIVTGGIAAMAALGFAAVPAWGAMWGWALILFAMAKLAVWELRDRELEYKPLAIVRFLFLWVGMRPEPFATERRTAIAIDRRELATALFKTALGLAAVAFAGTLPLPEEAETWVGMIGAILLLHCGLFHLLALWHRANGYAVDPIMDRPLAARGVGEFWGRRWNRGFNDLVRLTLFDPLKTRIGPAPALLAVFLASGLVHELLLTIPAKGGYGLPTAYFGISALGILVERSRIGRRCGLGRGLRGRAFAWLVLAAPLPLLFPEPFLTRVMTPFFKAINAL